MARPVFGGAAVPAFIVGSDEVVILETAENVAVTPDKLIYKLLQRTSGPQSASGNDYDLDTDSDVTPTVFGYEVPAGKIVIIARVNLSLVDNSINPNDFGGIMGGLATGCLFQAIDSDSSTELLDFLDGVPIQQNLQFALLAGVDIPITEFAGDDLFPIRFTIGNSGRRMRLSAGQRIRWTNQDDLSALTKFMIEVQGYYE